MSLWVDFGDLDTHIGGIDRGVCYENAHDYRLGCGFNFASL